MSTLLTYWRAEDCASRRVTSETRFNRRNDSQHAVPRLQALLAHVLRGARSDPADAD